MKKYKIISFDGGGVRSLGFARYISELEKKYGKKAVDLFDAFTGTSAGALLAVLCALGRSGDEILELGKKLYPIAFEKPPLWKQYIPFGSKYQNINMRNAYKEALGEEAETLRMCDLPKPVYITVTDLIDQVSIVYDRDNNDLVLDVLEKSSCAPSYFDPVDNRYVDGGVWANNPALVGLLGFLRHTPGAKLEEMDLISMGNGKIQHNPKVMKYSKYFTLVNWAILLVSFLIDGHEESNRFYCEQLPLSSFKRVEVDTGDLSLAEAESIPTILERWEKAIPEFYEKDFLNI